MMERVIKGERGGGDKKVKSKGGPMKSLKFLGNSKGGW